ncbi:MAG: hypothetical protein JSW67_13285 [Candidatus Latescibacterota bacterium]|nr:MAG: hypothetical protein JSW67_13285 [Candidatus Latescibacterota bacterium]
MMKRLLSGISLGLVLVAASAIGFQSFAATNLLTNPGFEDGGGSYNGWTTFGSGPQISDASTDNIFRSGAAAAKIFGEFTDCPDNPQFDDGGFLQSFTPTPGMIYELSGYAYVSSADPIPGTDACAGNRLIAKIAFFNAGGFEVAVNEVVIGDWSTPLDEWNAFSVSLPAPANAQSVEALFLFLQPGCDTGAVFVDDTFFCELTPTSEPNLLANPSFDSGLSGWTTFGNVLSDTRTFAYRTPPGGAKLFGPFANPGDASGMFQSFTAAPGSVWRLDVFAMHTCLGNPPDRTQGDNFALARIVFRDATNAEIPGDDVLIVDDRAPLGRWTEYGVIATAPTGTVVAEAFILYIQPDSTEGGAVLIDDVGFRQLDATDVALAPAALDLRQNVPNPFNPATRIDFVLAQREAVDISVYDVAGRRIATLLQAELDPGPHHVIWNGRMANGMAAAAGTYRYVLRTSTARLSRSMVLLK